MQTVSDHDVRRLAEHTRDILISVDRTGVISYASPAVRIFGYAPEDIVGQTGLDLVHPQDRDSLERNTAALLRGELGAGADRQHRFRCADGRWAWVEGAPRLLRNETGELIGFVNVLRDVTARREAEAALRESEARLKEITEAMRDIIVETDLEARIVFVSPSIRAYGY